MATVPSLIEFYNNQNALATRVSEASASNQTSANIESARIGAEAKRLDQEKQLEFFRQKMEDLRNARATASNERVAMGDISAREQSAILSKSFEGSQNAAQRDFQLKLQEMNEAGAQTRQNQLLASNKDIANIDTVAKLEAEQRKLELGAPQAEADLQKTRAETAMIGRNKPATRDELIKQLNEAEKLPTSWFDKKPGEFKQRIIDSIKAELGANGENPDMIPEVIAAQAPAVAAKVKDLNSNLDATFAQYATDGRIQQATKLISDYQDAITSGRVNSTVTRVAIEKRLQAKLNALGVTSSDISKIKKMYSLD
jgi:hypothetical protein